jgi:hypothetical protein
MDSLNTMTNDINVKDEINELEKQHHQQQQQQQINFKETHFNDNNDDGENFKIRFNNNKNKFNDECKMNFPKSRPSIYSHYKQKDLKQNQSQSSSQQFSLNSIIQSLAFNTENIVLTPSQLVKYIIIFMISFSVLLYIFPQYMIQFIMLLFFAILLLLRLNAGSMAAAVMGGNINNEEEILNKPVNLDKLQRLRKLMSPDKEEEEKGGEANVTTSKDS